MQHLKTMARREIRLINAVFMSHRVRARVARGRALLTGQVIIYGLELAPGERVDRVRGLRQELAEAISNQRGTETPLRLQTTPLALEVPNPQPVPTNWRRADWSLRPGQMIAGRHYDLYARTARPVVLDLSRHHHILVAGTSGAGKSVLLQMLLLSLTRNTTPGELDIRLIDLKNDDLTALRSIPHVTAVATDRDQAARLINRVRLELAQRQEQPGRWNGPRTLLVIDEVAELRGMREVVDKLNSVTALGRALGVHLLAATQKPTKDRMGGLDVDNFTARLVGAVVDARTAAYITGRGGTGAEFLTRPGGFIAIDGPTITRFQSYHIPEEDLSPLADEIRNRWPGQSRRAISLAPLPEESEPEPEPVNELALLADAARPAFRAYYNPDTGQLERGGMAAVIAAMFGPHANTGGANRRRALQVIELLAQELTEAQNV